MKVLAILAIYFGGSICLLNWITVVQSIRAKSSVLLFLFLEPYFLALDFYILKLPGRLQS